MTFITSFDEFAAQLRAFIAQTNATDSAIAHSDTEFNRLASALFSLQVAAVPVYAKFCARRKVSAILDWREIPALPTAAFKEYEVTSLPSAERLRVFHSSGTMQQTPSRHFHNAESMAIYEASLLPWFRTHFLNSLFTIPPSLFLTPSPALTPHSSLVHMFETVGRESAHSLFAGELDGEGAWALRMEQIVAALEQAQSAQQPLALLGPAFSFVHLLDHCHASQTRYRLPAGSRVMETGGYKGRSRVVPKLELHRMITKWLGIPASHILTEYGMSELSSQAYDRAIPGAAGAFHFPPWARVRIVSPETGREVGEGETGMLQVFDLANVRSVMAVQTEDLAIKRGDGFELIGRDTQAEPRGCSLMLQ
jgi:Acyl-protein synthetase, LuxE